MKNSISNKNENVPKSDKKDEKEIKKESKKDKMEKEFKESFDIKILNKKTNRSKDEIKLENNEKLNIKNKNDNNELDIYFCMDIINDSYSNDTAVDNMFIVFKAINDILYIIYAKDNPSIIIYNLIDNKKINEIKNAHSFYINNFKHYLDKINKRDLVLSISSFDNNIKLWNINTIDCLLNIKNAYNKGEMYSACFLFTNKQLYIVSCNDYYPNKPGPIKIFNLEGKKTKEINNSKERTFFIDIYYDNKFDNIYILVGNKNYVKSYDYLNNKLYQKYCDESFSFHNCIIVYKGDDDKIIKLIESSNDGNIRIWNFRSGELLKKYEIFSNREFCLYGMCLLRNEYLFVGCNDKTVKLLEINNGKITKTLHGHYDIPSTVKIINHPYYGESLITKGGEYDMIKLWIIKNKIKNKE